MTAFSVFSQTGGATVSSDSATYTLTMLFTVSSSQPLTGIWFYSPPTATVLPTACGVFQKTGALTGTLVASNTSPSWSGAAGSGWVLCSFDGTVTLTTGNNYNVAILLPGTSSLQYSATAHYWDTGAGSGGVTNGPLTALSNTAAQTAYGGTSGQDAFISPSATLTYPTTAFNAANYWVDVQVGTNPAAAGAVTPGDDDRRSILKKIGILGL